MKRNETEILKKPYVCVRFVNFREVFFILLDFFEIYSIQIHSERLFIYTKDLLPITI